MRTLLAFVLASFALINSARAQPTAFTYQGQLKNGAQPAAGPHDMRFRLFDAASGGTQVGTTQCANNVPVTTGTFAVQLDFGQQFATPSPRFLEIHVRADIGQPCSDESGFVVLTPRQPLTASPLAAHAASASSLAAADGSPANAVVVDNSGNVGIGTTVPTAKLDVRGGALLVENLGDQADLLWLASERSWVFRQEGVGAATALKLQSTGGGGNKNFLVQTDGFMGVGTLAPQAKLDVRGDIRLGPSGQWLASAGVENLRTIRCAVAANGTVTAGSGFTVTRLATGRYLVGFSPPFAGPPSLSAMAGNQSTVNRFIYEGLLNTAVEIRTFNGSTPTDCDFTLIAVGPR